MAITGCMDVGIVLMYPFVVGFLYRIYRFKYLPDHSDGAGLVKRRVHLVYGLLRWVRRLRFSFLLHHQLYLMQFVQHGLGVFTEVGKGNGRHGRPLNALML